MVVLLPVHQGHTKLFLKYVDYQLFRVRCNQSQGLNFSFKVQPFLDIKYIFMYLALRYSLSCGTYSTRMLEQF